MSFRCGQLCILCNILDFGMSGCGTQKFEILMGLGRMSEDMLNSRIFGQWFTWVLKTFHISNCLFSLFSLSSSAVSSLTRVGWDLLCIKAFVLTLKLLFNKIIGVICKRQLLLWGTLTYTVNALPLFSCGYLLSGISISCNKLWRCSPHLPILHLSFNLHSFMKCAFAKQFQQSLLVETNSFLSCRFFLINFLQSICVSGWLHNQQTIFLSVYLSLHQY